MLNLNGSLTKAGIPYSTIWSLDFSDDFFLDSIRQWIHEGKITHDTSHVRDLNRSTLPEAERTLGEALARQLAREKAIIGIFDEGCMGMYNAFIDDEMINAAGIYKERLSQSALVAKMRTVSDDEAQQARDWLDMRGLTFMTGSNPETDLTDDQILEQLKMYIATVRIAQEFGCAAVGIQYQQGLKDMVPASDLAEGLLNNVERPPVFDPETGEELFAGKALPHFNEVDEGAAVDALVTNRIWTALGLDPATTLHDIRYGEHYTGDGLGIRDFRGGTAVAFHRRLRGGGERAAAADVLSARRWDAQGHQQAGRDRLEPRVRHGWQAARRSGTRIGRHAAARGDRAPLVRNNAAVADHARCTARRLARSNDGASQGESPQRRLRAVCGRRGQGAGRQSRHVRGDGHRRASLRRREAVGSAQARS
jgi:hypothetical protein